MGFGGPTYWGSMPFTDYPNYMGLGILLLGGVGAARFKNPRIVTYLLALSLFALLTSFGSQSSPGLAPPYQFHLKKARSSGRAAAP